MSDSPETAASEPTPSLDPQIAWRFCRFAGAYWSGASARQAWLLTLGLGLALALSTAATVALNQWNRWFFDALERKDVAAVWSALFSIGGIVAAMAAIGVAIVVSRESLQVRWRAWLIGRLLERWLGERRFYQLNVNRTEPGNPEYRIADDTRWATEPLTDLGIGLVIAVLNAAAFISILWSVGGSYTLVLGGVALTIPAYMVLLALAYGALMSLLMLWIGRPLPSLVYAKNEREGDFRFALMRLRENAESVALMSGHVAEQVLLRRLFDHNVSAWMRIVRRHGHVTWVTNASGPLIPIVPLLFAAPKYLAGDLTLGQVTQLAGAFIAVQGAISWVVDNFNRIAEWYASARRVMDIVDACEIVDAGTATGADRPGGGVRIEHGASGRLELDGIAVVDPTGTPVVAGASLMLRPGETVHIQGDTSTGKTTLVRAITQLWTRGEGTVRLPGAAASVGTLLVVPQKPYVPLGTLADAILYPRQGPDDVAADATLARAALLRVGLGRLAGQLAEVARWDQLLASGERQRLAIARALVHRPQVIILDDALSALDEASQIDLVRAMREARPDAIIVSLGQKAPPAGLADRLVAIASRGGVSTIVETTKVEA